MNREHQKLSQYKTIILVILAFSLLLCLFFFLLLYNAYGSRTTGLDDADNTIWECRGYDIYLIVDSHGYVCGEISENGVHEYFRLSYKYQNYARFVRAEINADGTAIHFVDEPEESYELIGYVYLGAFVRQQISITVQPEDFHLWDTNEPVTLTFVCKGHIPEVDIYNGIDPIRRMEVID